MNKRKIMAVVAALTLMANVACNDYETYGERKEKERDNIDKFLADSAFTVISEAQFHAQGDSTSVAKKEFVLLEKSGVYMQIVNRGCGDYIKDKETLNILCRFVEINIEKEKVLYNAYYYVYNNDVVSMYIQRAGSTYTARFTHGKMFDAYGSSVPEGWLAPLNYVKIGRYYGPDDELASVRLIVPHSKGHSVSSQNVSPYYYEITFQRER